MNTKKNGTYVTSFNVTSKEKLQEIKDCAKEQNVSTSKFLLGLFSAYQQFQSEQ